MSKESLEIDTIETTVGELVETITQIALELGKSEQESYELASLAIESILRRNTRVPSRTLLQ